MNGKIVARVFYGLLLIGSPTEIYCLFRLFFPEMNSQMRAEMRLEEK